jgi:hypothetical protein
VRGESTFLDNVNIEGDESELTVEGAVILEVDLEVEGDAVFKGDEVTIENGLTVEGELLVEEDVLPLKPMWRSKVNSRLMISRLRESVMDVSNQGNNFRLIIENTWIIMCLLASIKFFSLIYGSSWGVPSIMPVMGPTLSSRACSESRPQTS